MRKSQANAELLLTAFNSPFSLSPLLYFISFENIYRSIRSTGVVPYGRRPGK